MPAVTLKAHWDGERVLLDEPFEIAVNAQLMVTILPSADSEDADDWKAAAKAGIARAYGDDEPDYSLNDVKR